MNKFSKLVTIGASVLALLATGGVTAQTASAADATTLYGDLQPGYVGQYTDEVHWRGWNYELAPALATTYDSVTGKEVPCTTALGSTGCDDSSYWTKVYFHYGKCLNANQVSCIADVKLNGASLTFDHYVGSPWVTVAAGTHSNWQPANLSVWRDANANQYVVNVMATSPHAYSREYTADIFRVSDVADSKYQALTLDNINAISVVPHRECAYLENGHCGKIIDFLPNRTFALTVQSTMDTALSNSSPTRALRALLGTASVTQASTDKVSTETITGTPVALPTFYKLSLASSLPGYSDGLASAWYETELVYGGGAYVDATWTKVQGPLSWNAEITRSSFQNNDGVDCGTSNSIVQIESGDSELNPTEILEPVLATGNRTSIHVQISLKDDYAACKFSAAGPNWAAKVRIFAHEGTPAYGYPLNNVTTVASGGWHTFSADLPVNAWKETYAQSQYVEVILPQEHRGSNAYLTGVATSPKVSGAPKVGNTLTIVAGIYVNLTPVKIKGYIWHRCSSPKTLQNWYFSCVAIPNSNSKTYKVQKADVGKYLIGSELWTMPSNAVGLDGVGAWSANTAKVSK